MKMPYDNTFYAGQADGSARSAREVVRIVLEHFAVGSVVDVGCGVGTWLAAFAECGVSDQLGIDGPYVEPGLLRIPPELFMAADLTAPLSVTRRFDLACSLEVAEHLPESAGPNFVAGLVALAPVVLFSAAIPRQGGTAHVNERWQSYWADLFASHGYVALDLVRPWVFGNPDVEFWYQQNILVFSDPARVPANLTPVSGSYALDRIHPLMLDNLVSGPHSGKEAVSTIGRCAKTLGHALGRRLLARR
jgi:SAM-dependent methyltransferase